VLISMIITPPLAMAAPTLAFVQALQAR
jgi:hypothetical protein